MASMFIDLTHRITHHMPVFPGDPSVEIVQNSFVSTDQCNTFQLSCGMHTGTHMDAPLHMMPDGHSIAEIPLENCTGIGKVVSCKNQSIIQLSTSQKAYLSGVRIILFYTGFDRFWGTSHYFTDHPVLSSETSTWLIEQNVKLIGMDCPSPDYFPFSEHIRLLSSDVIILENLMSLNLLLPNDPFFLYAFPLNISTAGSIVRVVAKQRR